MPKPRKKVGVEPKKVVPKLHIICEGEKTEPNYFKRYVSEKFGYQKLLEFIDIPKIKKNTPVQLVEESEKIKNSHGITKDDIFWVVYDRESVTKYKESDHAKAYQKAMSNCILVALTNVCFEFWMLLHFKDTTAQYSSFENFMRESEFQRLLNNSGFTGRYDKAHQDIYAFLSKLNGVDNARVRAKKILDQYARDGLDMSKPYNINPYTNVHELLDGIDEFLSVKPKVLYVKVFKAYYSPWPAAPVK